MGGVKWLLLLLLLIAAGPVLGQDQETIDKALGSYFDKYTDCIKKTAKQLAKTTEAADRVADRAFAACAAERKVVLEAAQKPPVGYSSDEASAEMLKADADLRPLVLKTISEIRG